MPHNSKETAPLEGVLSPGPAWLPLPVTRLAEAVATSGGRLWLVGGFVRDHLLGRPSKDIDIEVHGMDASDLEALLQRHGRVSAVGRSFGVFKLKTGRIELDVALPRASGSGDPAGEAGSGRSTGHAAVGIHEAARRRDLSINAMALDPRTGELCDPCGGQRDIGEGILRAADPSRFGEDPLRVLRVSRFAAQLGFRADPELVARCRTLPLEGLPAERVLGEVEKLLLSPWPGRGWAVGRDTAAWSRVLPELVDPVDDTAWERLAALRERVGPDPRPLALGWAVALRETPEPAALALFNRLRLRAREGYPLRDQVQGALAAWSDLDGSDAGLRALAERGDVALITTTGFALSGEARFLDALERASALGVRHSPLPPLLYGRDLAEIGVPAGPEMGELLSTLRRAQIEGSVSSPEEARVLLGRLWSPG